MRLVSRLNSSVKRALKSVLRPLLGARSATRVRPVSPEYWGLKREPTGSLMLDGVVIPELTRTWGSPLHIINAARLRENARRFLAVPPGRDAGCEILYSYKTNPVPGVLAELHAIGLGAEVISHYELWLAQLLGVPPDRIVFNGPAKSNRGIREAVAAGIQVLNINHREEIAVVAQIARQLERRARVGIRVTLGQGWSGQFGIPVEGGQALAAYADAARSSDLEIVGLHAHRGGMIHSEQEVVTFVTAGLEFADHLYHRLGLSLEVLNFGGSLATPTVRSLSTREVQLNRAFQRELAAADPSSALSIDRYVDVVVGIVEAFYRARHRPRPRIFLEPGRAVTGDAQMLLATVLGIKASDTTGFAILDAGVNLAESCRSEYHQLFVANHPDAKVTDVYTMVGPICTPGDTLYWAVRLPELRPGDSVLIMDAGAYFIPFSTSFSFPRPAIVRVDGGVVTELRRSEQFEDLIAYDTIAEGGIRI